MEEGGLFAECFGAEEVCADDVVRDVTAGAALHEAKAFVCIVSPTYVTRPVCSKEFAAFVERYEVWKRDCQADWKATHPGELNPPSFIITLEWEKFLFGAPPAALTRFQTSDDEFPDDYKIYGLRDFLMFKKPQTKAYVDLVRVVATLVATAMAAVPPVPPANARPDFDAPGDLFTIAAEPVRLADAIAAAAGSAIVGKVENAEVEAEAREMGVQFDLPPVLASQPEGTL